MKKKAGIFLMAYGLFPCFSRAQSFDLGLPDYKTSVQSPYRLDVKKDLGVAAGVVAGTTMGYFLKGLRTPLDSADVLFPDTSRIPSFDLVSIHQYDNTYVSTSNIVLGTAMLMPFIAFFDKRVSGHAPQVVAMYFETLGLNFGLQTLSVSISNRRRPYTFNTDSNLVYNAETDLEELQAEVPLDVKLRKGNQNSFYSGHTSMAAAATFFGARVFTDFRPHSKLVPVVWGAAAIVPAFAGYSRIKAGKHYPSDVVTGYLVGAAIGYLVPTLHKIKNDRLSFSPTFDGQGFVLHYRF
jgi:uncharacterized membrane protein